MYGRDIALISHSQGLITDEELVFPFRRKHLDKSNFRTMVALNWKNPRANLNSDSRGPQRCVADGIEALCILLKQMTSPCRTMT